MNLAQSLTVHWIAFKGLGRVSCFYESQAPIAISRLETRNVGTLEPEFDSASLSGSLEPCVAVGIWLVVVRDRATAIFTVYMGTSCGFL